MTQPPRVGRYLIGTVLLAWFCAAGGAARPLASPPAAAADSAPAIVRYYTMNARVRPFLLWITRADIGGARISWSPSAGADARMELLVGSDPDRAPWSLNRWGFLAEQRQGDTTRLTGVMTETDERWIDGARSPWKDGRLAGRSFRAMQSTIVGDRATISSSRLAVEADLTYRQYETLLERLPAPDSSLKQISVAPGVEPGFLIALRKLVHDSVDAWQRRQSAPRAGLRCDCVYMGNAYQLTLRSATLVPRPLVNGRSYGPAVDAGFEVRNRATGAVSQFEMLFGVAGAEAETPLRIVYRPRWWIELELLLEETSASKMALSMAPRR